MNCWIAQQIDLMSTLKKQSETKSFELLASSFKQKKHKKPKKSWDFSFQTLFERFKRRLGLIRDDLDVDLRKQGFS